MTHDERVEKDARAIHYISDRTLPYETEHKYWNLIAEAALAAAGVEEMVREAAYKGYQQGRYGSTSKGDDVADIVREVMGK